MAQEIKRSAKHVSHAFTPNPTTAYATYCTATTRFIMRVCWDISGFLWETIKPLIKQLKDTGSLPESLVVIRVDHSMDVEATSGTSRISKKPAKRSKKAKNTEGDLEYCYKCKLQDVEVDIPLSGALNTTGQLQVKLEELMLKVILFAHCKGDRINSRSRETFKHWKTKYLEVYEIAYLIEEKLGRKCSRIRELVDQVNEAHRTESRPGVRKASQLCTRDRAAIELGNLSENLVLAFRALE